MLIACRAECPKGRVYDGDQCVADDDDTLAAGQGGAAGQAVGGSAAAAGGGMPAANMLPGAGVGALGGVNVIVNLGASGAPPQPLAAGSVASVSSGNHLRRRQLRGCQLLARLLKSSALATSF